MADGPRNQGKRSNKSRDKKKFDGKYIRYELSVDDKQRLREREWDSDRVFDQLHALVESGFKFSVGLQSDGSSYLASLYDRDEDSPTAGFTLTGRGRSFSNAVAALLYKHYDLFDGIWPTRSETDEEWG